MFGILVAHETCLCAASHSPFRKGGAGGIYPVQRPKIPPAPLYERGEERLLEQKSQGVHNGVHGELLQAVYLGCTGAKARAEPAGFTRQASPQYLHIRRKLAQAQVRCWTEQHHGRRAYSRGYVGEAAIVAHHSASGGQYSRCLP